MERHRNRPGQGVSPMLLVITVAAVAAGGWFLGTVQSPTDPPAASPVSVPSTAPVGPQPTGSASEFVPLYPFEDHAGNLPDDTPFLTQFASEQPPDVPAITASIVVHQTDEDPFEIGRVSIVPENSTGAPTGDGAYRRSFEGWTLIIDPTAKTLAVAEGDLVGWLDDHIINLPGRRLPAYRLLPPLRWADDAEATPPMRVEFETYAVGRGCRAVAIACSETHAVELVPTKGENSTEGFITSPSPRPENDPGYLNPGPLAARVNHRVVWTGSEVIVWGGDNGLDSFTDGAAYDPESETWRWLPESPFDTGSVVSSVWAEDRLLAFDSDTTAEYVPSSDRWRVVGTGIEPPESVERTVWSGGSVYAWADEIYRFDPPTWTKLPSPGANPGVAWETALIVFDETIYAVYLPWGDCSARRIARWTGSIWTTIPKPPPGSSNSQCASPRQVLALHPLLYAWSESNQPLTVYDPRTHSWSTVGVLPDLKAATPTETVGIDYRILMAQADEAWLYSPSSNAWTAVGLPGSLLPSTSVWTGTELINWGGACCYEDPQPGWGIDAWRLSLDP